MESVSTTIRTPLGPWRLVCYPFGNPSAPTVVLVKGEVSGDREVLVRVQSECFTGHVFGALSCDCGAQLDSSLDMIAEEGAGILIYLRQEGRGIGLMSKVLAYNLQAEGHDTVDANVELGFAPDGREYLTAAQILTDLGVARVRLLSNNPNKATDLMRGGLQSVEQVPLPTFARAENSRYLATKRDRMGHQLDLPPAL